MALMESRSSGFQVWDGIKMISIDRSQYTYYATVKEGEASTSSPPTAFRPRLHASWQILDD
jgi:hypothetical protein